MEANYSVKSINKVRTPKWVRLSALSLVALLIIGVLFLSFVPWQQTIMGTGRITSFSPNNRPQHIESPIKGRIKKWHVVEGMTVKKGDLIVELQDLEKEFLPPEVISLTQQSKDSLFLNRGSYLEKSQAIEQSIINSKNNLQDTLNEAKQKVVIAENDLKTAKLNLDRTYRLAEKGLVSEREKELAIQSEITAKGNLQRAKYDLDKITSKALSEITKLQSEKSEALANVSKVSDELAKTELKLSMAKVRKEISSIKAPSDGIVVKLLKRGPGETFKENEEIAVITPETEDQAVELFVSDIDAPLVSSGDPVRLQFSGWPAIQFAGFSENIQLGTFGGIVAVVDNVDSGNGKYRILVVPDNSPESRKTQPWPRAEYLRPGTRAAGWVILKTVPLGYELWRRFNGFPIALTDVNEEVSQKSDSSLGNAYSKGSGKEPSQIFKKKTK